MHGERDLKLVLGQQQAWRGGGSRGRIATTRYPALVRPIVLDCPMLPWSAELAGRLDEHLISSELLRDNPLGDPHERPLWVYVPPGYDDPSAATRRST